MVLRLVFAAVLVMAGGCGRPVTLFDGAPPTNLLVITLDTLRADHLGTYGYGRPVSPRLDEFAGTAFVFDDATCSVPTTLPSHVSIFTGLRPIRHGIRLNGVEPTTDLTTIFDLLAEQRGLATAAVVSAGVLAEPYLTGLGFEEIQFPARERQYQVPAQVTTAVAIDWLDEHGDEPFALWVHYYDTHEPYSPSEAVRERFDRGYTGPLPNRMRAEDLVILNKPEGWARLDSADLAHVEDLYDAEIAYLDEHLGRLLASLAERNASAETLIVIVGDHGQSLGDSAFFGHGRLLEPVIKVPLMIRMPSQTASRRVTAAVETIDLMPTLVELFGLDAPADLPGVSLVPVMAGRGAPARRLRMIERRHYPDNPRIVGAAVHGGDWKAVFYREEDGTESWFVGEAATGLDGVNLYVEGSERARSLAAAAAHIEAGSGEGTVELDDEQRRMLEALGYLD